MVAARPELSWASDLARISARVSAAGDLETALHTCAFQLRQVFSCAVAVFVATDSAGDFVPSASVGLPKENLGAIRLSADSAAIRSLVGATHLESAALGEGERSAFEAARSVLAAPLRRADRTWGVLTLGQNPMASPYDEAELALVDAVASHLALCVENFRLREQALELERVREIQEKLLPMVPPALSGGLTVAHFWKPARAVSGDYFDAIPLRDGSSAVCIADVIGKGMPAALLMSNVQAAVRAVALETARPSEVCARVNRVLAGNLAAGSFVTMFYAVLDAASGQLTYTNAGHCAPMIVRADGTTVRLEHGGALLGVFRNWTFEEATVPFTPGDRLVLYTDGVTELKDATDEEFGEERLDAIVRGSAGETAAAIRDRVVAAIRDYNGSVFQDDVTAVVIAAD